MIFGRWGTFGRFLLLAAAIGMLSGVLWYLALIAVGGWDATADDLRIFPLFAAVGGGLGLVMGVPAYWTVRLCAQWIASRAASVLFFFALGAASALLGFVVFVMVFGGPSSYAYDSVSGVVATIAGPVLVAGALTAFASFRIVEPAEDVNLTSIGSSD